MPGTFALFVENAGDIFDRTVGIIGVTEGDLAFVFHRFQRVRLNEIIAIAMRDDDVEFCPYTQTREIAVGVFSGKASRVCPV